jgi:hypothetical protein
MLKHTIDGDRVFVIHRFFDEVACQHHIDRSERQGYSDATITTMSGSMLNRQIRDNARLMVDDLALADSLWDRLRPFIPPTVEGWRVVGLNERFRYYRYDPGQKFAQHFDGSFERDNGERSQLTCLVYLNEGFEGGETKFYGDDREVPRVTVTPALGMALVFAHRQLHEGAPVVAGRKYVLRTDVMYARLASPR